MQKKIGAYPEGVLENAAMYKDNPTSPFYEEDNECTDMPIDIAIGGVIEVDGERIKCIASPCEVTPVCEMCRFKTLKEACLLYACRAKGRADGKNVIFV